MDFNNNQVKKPIIRCFVELSGFVGHIKYVSVQQNYSIELCNDDALRKEILFEDVFMEEVFTPVFCYLRDHYSNSDATLMVRSLIETGIGELKRRYGAFLFYKENGMIDQFHPIITIGDTKIMPYLIEVYESLKEHFPDGLVDQFCIKLGLYGVNVVKELPDTQVFGSNGYQTKMN